MNLHSISLELEKYLIFTKNIFMVFAYTDVIINLSIYALHPTIIIPIIIAMHYIHLLNMLLYESLDHTITYIKVT